MAINAGDKNTVRNVVYERIRVEAIEEGQLFDIRVVFNKDYNPSPGRSIENITLRDVEYVGGTPNPSRIHGYDGERAVEGVHIENLRIGGRLVDRLDDPAFDVNEFARSVTIR
jgi:hypothetical protein